VRRELPEVEILLEGDGVELMKLRGHSSRYYSIKPRGESVSEDVM